MSFRFHHLALVLGCAAACARPPGPAAHAPVIAIAIAPPDASLRERVAPGPPPPATPEDVPSALARGWTELVAGRAETGHRVLEETVRRIERRPLRPDEKPSAKLRGLGIVDSGVLVDGTDFAVLEGRQQLLLVDVATKAVADTFTVSPNPGFTRAVRGQPLVVVAEGSTLHVLEVKERKLVELTAWSNVASWTVASDGTMVLVELDLEEGSARGSELVAWDTGARVERSRTRLPRGGSADLALVDRNRVALVGFEENRTGAYELGSGRELFVQASPYLTTTPAFSTNERWAAYVEQPKGGNTATTVVLVDRTSAREIARSSACPAPIATLEFDPAGPMLAVSGPGTVCFVEAPSLRVVAHAVTVASGAGPLNLERLGGRFLLASSPNGDESAILELPTRRLAFRGTASSHIARDGSRFVLVPSPSGRDKWFVDDRGALRHEPWTGRAPGNEIGARDAAHRASLELTREASQRLCVIDAWIVPIEACAP